MAAKRLKQDKAPETDYITPWTVMNVSKLLS